MLSSSPSFCERHDSNNVLHVMILGQQSGEPAAGLHCIFPSSRQGLIYFRLAMNSSRMTLNFCRLPLSSWCGMAGMCYHVWFMWCWGFRAFCMLDNHYTLILAILQSLVFTYNHDNRQTFCKQLWGPGLSLSSRAQKAQSKPCTPLLSEASRKQEETYR